MLQLREFTESDLALAEAWLHKAHVRKWYEIPQLGVTLEDWMMEYKERNGKYQWIKMCIRDRVTGIVFFALVIIIRIVK